MAEFIGNQLGQFREADFDRPVGGGGEAVLGLSSRICVGLNVLKPLGHIMKLCECQLEPGFNEKQDPLPFGPWLRALTPAILCNRGPSMQYVRPSFSSGIRPTPAHVSEPKRGLDVFNYSLAPNNNHPQPSLRTYMLFPHPSTSAPHSTAPPGFPPSLYINLQSHPTHPYPFTPPQQLLLL
ncbi:hypothetical protein Salat_1004500 [Sesamum alatum]|uniref:Uncharacterized protein n=1 Tax=Sesamum alatum TaxID=300844 RepID=A0AAE2CSD5_9LAMI|nr:hypothetical protein Salat_1004500 [Sesamum alatum]